MASSRPFHPPCVSVTWDTTLPQVAAVRNPLRLCRAVFIGSCGETRRSEYINGVGPSGMGVRKFRGGAELGLPAVRPLAGEPLRPPQPLPLPPSPLGIAGGHPHPAGFRDAFCVLLSGAEGTACATAATVAISTMLYAKRTLVGPPSV